ncbi:MAG TPA: DUF3119 family protein [Candidatus Obscuribacterales bacterium]
MHFTRGLAPVTATPASTPSTTVVELSPSYILPVVLVLAAVPLLWVQVWVSLAIALFGLFLLFQAATLRLRFTTTDLDVCRGDTLIRRFPYQDWQNWQIFWPPVPILFYFKEVKSIHFLPILFDPKMLQTCLEQHCPKADFQ